MEEWMMFIVVEHGVFIRVRGGSNRFATCFDMSVQHFTLFLPAGKSPEHRNGQGSLGQ
jgi:hypothetical protein